MNEDLEFLREILDRLQKAPADPTQYEYVKEMVRDWIEELEEKQGLEERIAANE